MRHAILGAGGVGGLIGACLAHSGASVTLVVRREAFANYPRQLHLESPFGNFAVDVAVAIEVPPVDVLWITVKATQFEPAFTALKNPDSVRAIVPLLNGIDHIAVLRAKLRRWARDPGDDCGRDRAREPGAHRPSISFCAAQCVVGGAGTAREHARSASANRLCLPVH